MATRVVEGKKPYTGGKAISIDENKVISLNLRDENNLIIYDEGDDEIYVDLQLPDEITPTDAFPIGVNVGRVIVDNGWDLPGTIISAVTTSGDNIKIFYADEGTLRIDNGTGTFKQIYFKADVDALLLALRNYIDGELAKKQNGVSSDTAPSNPSEGDLWYDTTNDELKVYDGSNWTGVGGGDVLVSDQANNIFTPGMKIWGGTESDYQSLTPDSNTAYLLLAGGPTPPSPRQPGANTVLYFPLTSDAVDTIAGVSLSNGGGAVSYVTPSGLSISCAYFSSAGYLYKNTATSQLPTGASARTISGWINFTGASRTGIATYGSWDNNQMYALDVYESGISSGRRFTQWGSGSTVGSTQPLNTWTNVILTYDGSNIVWYLNGVQDNSWTYTINTSNNNLYLGADMSSNSGSVSGGLQGYLSQVIVEDRCWTAQEISDYYNQTKGDYGIS